METGFSFGALGSENRLEKSFALLGKASGAYFFLCDIDKGECIFSPELLRMAEFSSAKKRKLEDVLGKLLHSSDWEGPRAFFAAVKTGRKKKLDLDVRIEPNNGEDCIWMHLRARVTHDEGKKNKILVGSLAPIPVLLGTDTITGLPNHGRMMADMTAYFEAGQTGFLIVLDIDDFKAVNIRHGRLFGNRLLQLFTAELKRATGGGGRVYRLESDRFAVHLPEKNRAAVSRMFLRIQKNFIEASRQLMDGVFCTLSAGAASYPNDSEDFTQLFQFADSSLSTAKSTGKDTMVFFSRDEYEQYLLSLAMREALQRCIKNDFEGFEVFYQPQISVKTGTVIGAEALLRWTSREQGKVPPDVFIPLMEKYGLICEVGRWVIDQALAQCREWREMMPDFCVSINVSYIQLEKDDIAGYILEMLRKYRLPGSAVLLELTESVQLHNYSLYNETLAYLKRIGVNVAIDDFGTGYSSLGYFKQLNVHQVKIDRSFVSRIRESSYDFNLVQFIIELAHSIGVEVCVEGVETEEELSALVPMAPSVAQGFHFGRAVGADTFKLHFLEQEDGVKQSLQNKVDRVHAAQKKKRGSSFNGERDLEQLLDEIEEIVHVSDFESHEMLFLNKMGRSFFDVDNYKGEKCYEVMHGRTNECDYCPKAILNKDAFHTWETASDTLGGRAIVKDKLVYWGKRKARIGTTCIIASGDNLVQKAFQEQEEGGIIVSCLNAMPEARNVEEAISVVIHSIGSHYRADRVQVFELQENGAKERNTYEWCGPDIVPKMGAGDNPSFVRDFLVWDRTLMNGSPVVVTEWEMLAEEASSNYVKMREWGLHAIAIVPLYLEGAVAGYVEVDNPRASGGNVSLLTALSCLVAGKITERKMREEVDYLSHTDMLTGARNRNSYLKSSAYLSSEKLNSLGVVFVDINGMNEYNKMHGNELGDEIIRQVADDVVQSFKEYPLYRIGGDEFVVLCRDIEEASLMACVQRLQTIAKPREYSISVGSVWETENFGVMPLISRADRAMYTDKQTSYNRY